VDRNKVVLFDWTVKDLELQREFSWRNGIHLWLTGKSYWDCKIKDGTGNNFSINISQIISKIGKALDWLKDLLKQIGRYL
jgi:hypothetical protein